MTRFLSLVVFFVFSVMLISGCSSYTIDRAEIEIKKMPSHTEVKKEDDDEEHDSRDFGQSHKKEWNKEKYNNKKEDKEMKKKKEHDGEDD